MTNDGAWRAPMSKTTFCIPKAYYEVNSLLALRTRETEAEMRRMYFGAWLECRWRNIESIETATSIQLHNPYMSHNFQTDRQDTCTEVSKQGRWLTVCRCMLRLLTLWLC